MLSRDALLAVIARRQQTIESARLGGALVIRELTRAEWRTALEAARSDPDPTTGAALVNLDRWNAHLFAAGVIGEDGLPLVTAADVLAWPNRDALWDEVARIAGLILELSDQQPDAVKKKSSP